MTKLWKILLAIVFSFSFLFVSIGFAATSGELSISGEGTYTRPEIYISEVGTPTVSGGSWSLGSTFGTVINSGVVLDSASSYVIVPITVKNRTADVYGYRASYAVTGSDTYDNTNVTYSLWLDAACQENALVTGERLYPEDTADHPDDGGSYATELTFYAKFVIVSGASGPQTLNSILNFEFITPAPDKEEAGGDEAVVDNVVDKMEEVLDDPAKITMLIGKIQEPPADSNRNPDYSYIGTVVGSHAEDSEFVKELFDGTLEMVIDGEKVEVTLMIKYEDINSDGIKDMVLYSSPYDPSEYKASTNWAGTNGAFMPVWAQIYFGVETGSDGETAKFEKAGESYEGTASVNAYDPEPGWFWDDYSGNDSYNTGTWISTPAYTVNGNTVAAGSDISAFADALGS